MKKQKALEKLKQKQEQKKKVEQTMAFLKQHRNTDLSHLVPLRDFLHNRNKKTKKDKPLPEQNNSSSSEIQEQEKPSIFCLREPEPELEVLARRAVQFNTEQFNPKKPLRVITAVEQEVEQQAEKDARFESVLRGWAETRILNHPPQIQEWRKNLPAYEKQYDLVEAVNSNLVVFVSGETGSGKSTQIPQYLVAAGYGLPTGHNPGMVGVTQPRRIAAVSLADRIAYESGLQVSYQVRFEKRVTETACIKLMTDGILLNEISSDFLLNKYSVVIVDEAHQRKVNGDLLIGLLSRILPIRAHLAVQGKGHPLRLIIMSATLQTEAYLAPTLFKSPPSVISIGARMFPVNIYYNKQSNPDYVKEAVSKCVKIHRKLPPGDVLIFLTGEAEIWQAIDSLGSTLAEQNVLAESEGQEQPDCQNREQPQPHAAGPSDYRILPLYSALPLSQQRQIFAPFNGRTFIFATNVAQTSITVPSVRYVVDCGLFKRKIFDGIWKWRTEWISKAVAKQRAGRAGRVAKGYVYRLYSTAVYSNKFPEHIPPQIKTMPLENVVLQLKLAGIANPLLFPFPTMPDQHRLRQAIRLLLRLGALDGTQSQNRLTELGQAIGFLPLSPKYGKMLLTAKKKALEREVLLAVSYMSTDNFQIQGESADSDLLRPVQLLAQLMQLGQPSLKQVVRFAKEHGLSQNRLKECREVIGQICLIFEQLAGCKLDWLTLKPNPAFVSIVSQGLLGHIARRVEQLRDGKKYQMYETEDGLQCELQSCSVLKHKQSSLLAYLSVIERGGRRFLHCNSAVRAYQLEDRCINLVHSQSPHPVFDSKHDFLLFQTSGQYGPARWPLVFLSPIRGESSLRYCWFARLLFAGKVVKKFTVQKWLAIRLQQIKPNSLKTAGLLNRLSINKVDGLNPLRECLRRQPQFLKAELQSLALKDAVKEVRSAYSLLISLLNS